MNSMRNSMKSLKAAALATLTLLPAAAQQWNVLTAYAHPTNSAASLRYEGGYNADHWHNYSFVNLARADGESTGYFESRLGARIAGSEKRPISLIIEGDVGTNFDERLRAGIVAKGSLWKGNYTLAKAIATDTKIHDQQYTLALSQTLGAGLAAELRISDYSPRQDFGIFSLELSQKLGKGLDAVIGARHAGQAKDITRHPSPIIGIRYNF